MGPKKDIKGQQASGLRSGLVRAEPSLPPKNPFKSQEAKGQLQSSEPRLPHAQGDNHPKSAAPISNHDKNRLKCCLVCFLWCDEFVLNDTLKAGIHSLFEVEFDYSDRRIPLGICTTCRRGIYDFNRTKVNSRKLKLLYRN